MLMSHLFDLMARRFAWTVQRHHGRRFDRVTPGVSRDLGYNGYKYIPLFCSFCSGHVPIFQGTLEGIDMLDMLNLLNPCLFQPQRNKPPESTSGGPWTTISTHPPVSIRDSSWLISSLELFSNPRKTPHPCKYTPWN